MKARIAWLPGDGVGPEVTAAARRVLERIAASRGHRFGFETALIGGAAIDAVGVALPDETFEACRRADAVLLGAVGGPRWSDPDTEVRPEQGLLDLRRRFGLFANLRPIPTFAALAAHSPVKAEVLEGVDILFVRELTGGLYFGERREQGEGDRAYDTMLYTETEVERVAHVAFRAARRRRSRVTSVDKANVLASMRLWRRTVERVGEGYPDVELEHTLVDACALRIIREPRAFDVVLAGNLFGDILSDEAAVLAGSLGILPSASLADGRFGIYEPVHGSAPDIAGRGVANPIGAILSAAMLLRYSLELDEEAQAIERAVASVLDDGVLTADLASGPRESVPSEAFTEAVVDACLRPRSSAHRTAGS